MKCLKKGCNNLATIHIVLFAGDGRFEAEACLPCAEEFAAWVQTQAELQLAEVQIGQLFHWTA